MRPSRSTAFHAATLILCLASVVLASAGCGRDPGPPRGNVREWKASDHQPPEAEQGDNAAGGQAGGAAGEGQPEEDQDEDPTQRAVVALWNVACASCHGREGRGDGPMRPAGANVPDMTTAEFQARVTDEQMRLQITNGKEPMPAFGDRIAPEGITALVAHVRSFGPH